MSSRRLRIAVSTPTFLPVIGGAELGIHEIYSRIGRRHDVTVVTPMLRQESVAAYLASDYGQAPYEVVHLTSRLQSRSLGLAGRAMRQTSLPYFRELQRLHSEGRLDVVNFHFVRPHGAALVATRWLLRRPTVLSLVGRDDVLAAMPHRRRVYARAVMRNAEVVLPISQYNVEGEPRSAAIEVVPYGVDGTEFSPEHRSSELRQRLGVAEDEILLFTLQRLTPVKRVDVLIRMMAEPSIRKAPIKLVIGGQGDERELLLQLVRTLDLDRTVSFTGYIKSEELPAYFASADVFVFHSLLETFGIVLAQAMAAGLPLVAVRSSCIPEVVGPDAGALVEPLDVQGLSAAVLKFAADPELRAVVGQRNRSRALQKFDWDRIAESYEDAFLRLTGNRRSV